MMSMNELSDQISADKKAILDSIGTNEKGLPTPPMAPLEVLVRYTVFEDVDSRIDSLLDFYFLCCNIWESESEEERDRLEDASLEGLYDKDVVAEAARNTLYQVDYLDYGWAICGNLSDITLERRGLGETREQVRKLALAFLEELM